MQDRITRIDKNLLHRTAGPYIGSFSSNQPAPDALGMSASLGSRPNLRTAAIRRRVPQPDSCTAANSPLFDRLIDGSEQLVRHGEAKRLCGLEVNDQLELR